MKKVMLFVLLAIQSLGAFSQSNIVLLDVSGSMKGHNGENVMPIVQSQLQTFVEKVGADNISIVPFTDKVIGTFTGNDYQLNPIEIYRGNTNISTSFDHLSKMLTGKGDRVFLISDCLQNTEKSEDEIIRQLNNIKRDNRTNYFYLVALSQQIRETPIATVFDSTHNFYLIDSLYLPEQKAQAQVANNPKVQKTSLKEVNADAISSFNWWWLLVILILLVAIFIVCCLQNKQTKSLNHIRKKADELERPGGSLEDLNGKREEERLPNGLRKMFYPNTNSIPKSLNHIRKKADELERLGGPLESHKGKIKEERLPDGSIKIDYPGTNSKCKMNPDGTMEAPSGCIQGAPDEAPNYFLDNLPPNTHCEDPNTKSSFDTDKYGRTAIAVQVIPPGGIKPKTPLSSDRRKECVTKKGCDTKKYDAGHILSKENGGNNEGANLIPMLGYFQRHKSWREAERRENDILKKASNNGETVIRTRKVEYYRKTFIPKRIVMRVVSAKTGKVLFNETVRFPKPE